MNLKKLKFFGVIMDFILAFPLHFLYDLIPCFLTSIIAPVNESIWEHMKIIFGAIMLSSLIQKLIMKRKKMKYNDFHFASFVSAILSIIIFLIIYLPIYYRFGEHLPITLIIMLITFIIAEVIAIKIINLKDLKQEKLTIVYVLLIYVIFGLLTYFPPHKDLFFCSKDLVYGIKK